VRTPVAVMLALIVTSTGCAAQARHTYRGFEVGIKSVERVGWDWVYQEVMEFTAKPGAELVVVTLTVKALTDGGTFEPKTWELYAADGAKAETLIKSVSLRGIERGQTREAQLCFAVSRGSTLKTFKLDDVSFDVTALAKSLPSSK
jgi:hypothetical protein